MGSQVLGAGSNNIGGLDGHNSAVGVGNQTGVAVGVRESGGVGQGKSTMGGVVLGLGGQDGGLINGDNGAVGVGHKAAVGVGVRGIGVGVSTVSQREGSLGGEMGGPGELNLGGVGGDLGAVGVGHQGGGGGEGDTGGENQELHVDFCLPICSSTERPGCLLLFR